MPAAKSSELKADGDPLRLMLLGEELLAFRDSEGRVGVLDSLSTSLRIAVSWAKRRERHPLRVSRMGV
jgi:hypothetical protein